MKTNYFYKDKKIKIGTDEFNWVLAKNINKGRSYGTRYYYPNLKSLISALSEQEMRDSMGIGKKPVLSAIEQLKSYIKEVVEDVQA